MADPGAAIEADAALSSAPHKERLIGACVVLPFLDLSPVLSYLCMHVLLCVPRRFHFQMSRPLTHTPLHTDALSQLMTHLSSLSFSDRPDYDRILRLFDAMVTPGQEDLAALGPEEFDWEGKSGDVSGYQRAKQEEAGMDAGTRQLLLSKQVLALCMGREGDGDGEPNGSSLAATNKRERTSAGFVVRTSGGGGGGGTEDHGAAAAMPEIDLARMWARVGKRLVDDEEVRLGWIIVVRSRLDDWVGCGWTGLCSLTLTFLRLLLILLHTIAIVRRTAIDRKKRPLDPQQRLEQLRRLMGVARRHETFFLVDGLGEDEFAAIQLDALHRVERAYSRCVRCLLVRFVGVGPA